MTLMVDSILGSADYFVLLFFRVGGLVFASPIFGRINIPIPARVCLISAITYLLFTIFPESTIIEYSTLIGFVMVCAAELLLGMALAFVTNIFFSLTAFTAGQLIDMQIGYGIVNVFDAQNNTQIPMMGNVLNLMLLIMFFAVNGHLRLIEMVYLTIDRLPIGSLVISPLIGITALEVFVRAFMLGVMMALPLLAAGLIIQIAFGMLMRAVPQIHMFVIGIPLKMVVGLLVFSISLPVFVGFSARVFDELFLGIEKMFATFVEGLVR